MFTDAASTQKAYADAASAAIQAAKDASAQVATAYGDANSSITAAYQDTKTSNVRTLMIGARSAVGLAVSIKLIAKEV